MGCFVQGGKNGMGCYVRGDKNSMGCYVRGDKKSMGCFVRGGKSLWDVLSGVSKTSMGCFVPGCFVRLPRSACSDIWILSPLKKKKKRCQSLDPDQIRMEFRKECFVNLNIWACDRKHAKHQYCRISDFVVQKPMRTRSISKYHFQQRYMIFLQITRDSYASANLSLSLSLYHLLSC